MFHQCRRFATSCIRLQAARSDADRILQVVQRRIEDRALMLTKLTESMSTPEDIAIIRKRQESEKLQKAWDKYNTCLQVMEETRPLLFDHDKTMAKMAADEFKALGTEVAEIVNDDFPALLIPPSPTAALSALVEIKSGVGGAEACLFVMDMLRVYQRYISKNEWTFEVVSLSGLDGGGAREALLEVKGHGSYDRLRWESGVHRVQRIPATEAQGRVHTSTVAVIVLPLVDEKAPETDLLYKMSDIKLEVMRSRGAGGQHVNKTESAVRITHLPTGISVSMQDERSQHTNRRRAFQVLQARLMDRKIIQDIADKRARKNDVVFGTERSDKIRTYNYAQERVTDHRIGLTMRNLSSVMDGDGIEEFISALQKNDDETTMEDMLTEL